MSVSKAGPTPECAICAEKYNRSTRLPIKCMYCDYEACTSCCQRYILNEPVPKCMNTACDREWTRHFMARNFTKTFMKTQWRDHVNNQLYEREKVQLPNSQVTVELIEESIDVNREINELHKRISALQSEQFVLTRRLHRLQTRIRDREAGVAEGIRTDGEDERRKFIRNCPANECRGFLSQQWKCGLCNLWTCSECHEIIGPEKTTEHECVQSNIDSAKEIMKSTRPCPKCSTPIFRIEGCSQMWCTMCNTAFDWKTGKLYANNNIHNPHYFEYLRTRGEQPNANANLARGPCNGGWRETTLNVMRTLRQQANTLNRGGEGVEDFKQIINSASNMYAEFVRGIGHIEDVDLARFNARNENNEVHRCQYLRKYINEDEFKRRVSANTTKCEKNREYYQLFQMWLETAKELMVRFGTNLTTLPERTTISIINEFGKELNALNQYCNEQSREISETYDSSVYYEISTISDLETIPQKLEVTLRTGETKVAVNQHIAGNRIIMNSVKRQKKNNKEATNNASVNV